MSKYICERCGWTGTAEETIEHIIEDDSTVDSVRLCPQCRTLENDADFPLQVVTSSLIRACDADGCNQPSITSIQVQDGESKSVCQEHQLQPPWALQVDLPSVRARTWNFIIRDFVDSKW